MLADEFLLAWEAVASNRNCQCSQYLAPAQQVACAVSVWSMGCSIPYYSSNWAGDGMQGARVAAAAEVIRQLWSFANSSSSITAQPSYLHETDPQHHQRDIPSALAAKIALLMLPHGNSAITCLAGLLRVTLSNTQWPKAAFCCMSTWSSLSIVACFRLPADNRRPSSAAACIRRWWQGS